MNQQKTSDLRNKSYKLKYHRAFHYNIVLIFQIILCKSLKKDSQSTLIYP